MKKWICGFVFIVTFSCFASTSLEEGFQNPPNSARPRAYWCWVNGNFSLSQLTEELKDAQDKGMGGLDIWDVAGWVDPNNVVPAGPPFMGDESVQAIAHAIRKAEKYGIELGLTISSSWNAGGSWVEPEHGVMGLFRSEMVVKGPQQFDSEIAFPEIPETPWGERRAVLLHKGPDGLPSHWKPVAVLAYPQTDDSTIADPSQIIDLSGKVKNNGTLSWQVPEGHWRIVRYICTGTGQPLAVPSPNSMGMMIDHFSAEAMEMHLHVFLDKLQAELGDLSQTALKYLYTDSYEVNSAVWTPELTTEFQKRRGYAMAPWLPVLDGFTVKNPELSERFIFDYKMTLSDLIIDNHYSLGKKICNEYGLGFHAEAGGPGPPVHNCPFEALKSLGSLTAPRGEFWYKHPRGAQHMWELQIVKGPASSAHLYNQPYTEAEAFTSIWVWQEGPNDIRSVLDKALCEGLTRFVYHTQPHLPPEAGKPGWIYNFGTLMGPTRAWWPLSRGFNDYIARCCYLLMRGHFVGDVLFYYGDQAPNFVEPKHIIPSLGYGYDYDVCNSDIILNRMNVIDGRIVLPHGQSYEVLVLPESDRMNPDVLERIEQLVQKGLTVLGPKPSKSHSLAKWQDRDKCVQIISDRLWNSGKVIHDKTVRKVLMDKGIGPDIQIIGEADPTVIDFIHRTTDEAEIYFIRNTLDKPVDVDCIFRVKNRKPEMWNPETGGMQNIRVYAEGEDETRVPVHLNGNEAVFVLFRETAGKHVVSIKEAGKPAFPLSKIGISRTLHGDFICWKDGEVELKWSDGSKQKVAVSNIPKPIMLDGSWEVRFPHGWGAPQSIEFIELIDWKDTIMDGIRHFSGVAAYHKAFELAESDLEGTIVILNLGQVEEIARIYVNGHAMGIQSFNPYKIDVTDVVKPGKNYLVIEVANLMNNQMVGDASRDWEDKRTHSNITQAPNPWADEWKDVPLKPSGLLGPVQILFGKRLDQE
ncbi:hypothetical protein HQ585_20465 [candidate division KSB1 bacterium]|nr:hypothetical protein [candidate division KSB1 bacterium]